MGAPGTDSILPLTAVTLREVMEADVFRDCRIFGGEDGLENLVKKVTISEAPDSLDWLVGGELVVTSGYILSAHPETQEQWMTKAAAKGAAAIAIKPERFLGEIPASMIRAANKFHLPLIGIRYDIIWPEIIEQVINVMLAKRLRHMQDSFEIRQKLEASVLSSASLGSILNSLSEIVQCNVAMDDRYFSPIASSEGGDVPVVDQEKARLVRADTLPGEFPDTLREYLLPVGYADGEQMVMPVFSGKNSFGWLSAFPVPANRREFVRIALEQGATAIALEQLGRLTYFQSFSEKAKGFFAAMMSEKGLTHSEILRYGQEWNVDLSPTTMVIHYYTNPALSVSIFRSCIDTVRSFDRNGIVSMDGNTNCILYHPKATQPEGIFAEVRRLCYRLLSLCSAGNYVCHIGVGEPFSIFESGKLCRSYREAAFSVRHGQKSGDTILFYSEMGLSRFFPFIEDTRGAVQLAKELLRPLNESDEMLAKSLYSYIASGFSKTRASKELCIHINTLNYRLQKIQDITNVDISEMNYYLLLYYAMEILSFYEDRPELPSS